MRNGKKYGWISARAEHSHSYLLPACIKSLQKFNTKSMLDIGTGNGATIPTWLSIGINVAAMEPDDDGFSYAVQHKNVDVRKLGVGDALPSEWQYKFDAVVSLEVIEHLFDPIQLIYTAQEVLKKDGIIIVSTPYHGYLKNMALSIANGWDFHHHPARVGGHIKFWSKRTLSIFFTQHGFVESSFEGVGRVPFLWKSMIMIFRKI